MKDHNIIWSQCLELIKKSIDAQPYKTWFAPVKPVMENKNVLTIQVPNKIC